MKSASIIRPLALLVILLSTISCGQEYQLNDARCSTTCYSGSHETRGVGACQDGEPVCEGNRYVRCHGEILPEEEYCDNIDNDCNGDVDDHPIDYDIGDECGSNIGQCSYGSMQCIQGEVSCIGSTEPMEEVCDALDNDCNGIVDDIISSDFCYDGNIDDLLYGECHAGILQCNMGVEECYNQQMPEDEDCDGLDNDCDVLFDEDLEEDDEVDIFFAIDLSGSMSTYYSSVSDAAQLFSTAFSGNPRFRFAIIGVPYPSGQEPGIIMDFSDASDFQMELSLLTTLSNASLEPSWDSVYETCSEILPLSWKSDSKKYIILFTDEKGQSFDGIDEGDVAASCFDNEYVFYGFIDFRFSDFFDDIASETSGQLFPLGTPEQMEEDLSEIFSDTCL